MRALMPSLVLLGAMGCVCRAQAAGEKPPPAEKPRQNAAAADAQTLEAYRRGLAAARAGQHAAAIGHFNVALARVYLARGRVHLKRGDHQQAVADFTAALKLNPKAGYPHFERGVAQARMGNLAKALADFRAALLLIDQAPPKVADRVAWELTEAYARWPLRHGKAYVRRPPTGGKVPEELDRAMLINERLYRMQFQLNLPSMERRGSFRAEDRKIEFRIGPPPQRPEPPPEKH